MSTSPVPLTSMLLRGNLLLRFRHLHSAPPMRLPEILDLVLRIWTWAERVRMYVQFRER